MPHLPYITEIDPYKRKLIISFFNKNLITDNAFHIVEADSVNLTVLIDSERMRVNQHDVIDYINYRKLFPSFTNPLATFCITYFNTVNYSDIPSTA